MSISNYRCNNYDVCTIANARKDIQIADNVDPICPECGNRLSKVYPEGRERYFWIFMICSFLLITLLNSPKIQSYLSSPSAKVAWDWDRFWEGFLGNENRAEALPVPNERLPENWRHFPWPPPLASATATIPGKLLQKKSKPIRLMDVDLKLTEAIKQNGYYESSYYAIPKGFALVTRMEQIEPDGAPKKGPQRWNLKDQTIAEFSLAAYLKALLFASPGYYRVIVFIVTPVPFTQLLSAPTLEEAVKWLNSGYNRLPYDIGILEFSQDHICTALIYEFERASESDEPRFRQPGRIPGYSHLVKAGIWASLQQ